MVDKLDDKKMATAADVLSATLTVGNEKEERQSRLAQLKERQERSSTLKALGGTDFDNALLADSVKLAIDEGELELDTDVKPFDAQTPIYVDEDSGRELWAVYMTRGEHNIKLVLKADKGRTQIVEFVNNVLFVHTKALRDQVEAELNDEGSAFALAVVRCTRDQALHLVALQKQAQRSVAQSGALSTPFIRAAEGTLAAAMASAKGAMLAGGSTTKSFGV